MADKKVKNEETVDKKDNIFKRTGKFFKDAFRDMGESAKAQHEVDKANFAAAKAEAKANFEENRGTNTFKRAKENAKQSWDEAHMTPAERTAKMREEQKQQIEEANKNIKLANERYDSAKVKINQGECFMKKRNFIILVICVVAGLMFSLGMCMCLLPEWNSLILGRVLTAIGGVALATMGIIALVKNNKERQPINWKMVGKISFGVIAALILGLGMCMIMVWNLMLWGIIVGIVGLVMLLFLIPMFLGLKK